MDRETGTVSRETAAESESESSASVSEGIQSSAEDWMPAGTYTVGDSLPSGHYVLQQLPNAAVGYVRVEKGKKNLLEQNFEGCLFLSLESGQSLFFSGASLAPAKDFKLTPDLNQLDPGMYRVGVDIPAGSYEVAAGEEQTLCSFTIYQSDNTKREVRERDFVMAPAKVAVEDGELLELIGCTGRRTHG